MTERKRILLTGGGGYIGSVLAQMAQQRGYQVEVLDRFFFGESSLDKVNAVIHRGDSRDFNPDILRGIHSVVDLAAISNDPSGELDPEMTNDINYRARRRLQELCNTYEVERYVLASSCSVYGFQEEIVNENSPTMPLTTYANANLLAEKSAFDNSVGKTCFTAIRQATVFGLSPRMRFDLAVNAMTLHIWKSGSLRILRDGSQWRPMIHVKDTSRAILDILEQNRSVVESQIINIGANGNNFQILDLAKQISTALDVELNVEWYGDPDQRSYKVDFSKAKKLLGFEPIMTVADAALEIRDALASGETSHGPETMTVEWYRSIRDQSLGPHDLDTKDHT